MPTPSALLFDAGNTLVWLHYASLQSLIGRVQPPPSRQTLIDADLRVRFRLDTAFLDQIRRKGELAGGAASMGSLRLWQTYFSALFEAVGVPGEFHRDFIARVRRMDQNHPAGLWREVEPGLRETLSELRRRGYLLGVISNSDGRLRAKFNLLDLNASFDFVLDSAEVGIEKPDRRFFELGAAQLGIRPEECVYVGDIYAVDILAARRAGMAAILLDAAGLYTEIEPLRVRSCAALLKMFR